MFLYIRTYSIYHELSVKSQVSQYYLLDFALCTHRILIVILLRVHNSKSWESINLERRERWLIVVPDLAVLWKHEIVGIADGRGLLGINQKN